MKITAGIEEQRKARSKKNFKYVMTIKIKLVAQQVEKEDECYI